MENRRLIISILIIGGTLLGVLFAGGNNQAQAYGVQTHGFLTQEIVNFYNKRSENKISKEEADYLIDGSMHEDTHPRYLNHFYDPVNKRGLTDGGYKGDSAKEWAQSEDMQNGFKYKILARFHGDSILTANQMEAIKPVYNKTNFTWQKAVDLYARGEAEQAMFALGHVLHLIEDSAVPDHTRNDAHPEVDSGGSPYENWTKKFDLKNPDKGLTKRLANKKIISLNNLNQYFDSIANYSNNNFYSRDSIDKFINPKPDYFILINNKSFGFKKDSEFKDYPIVIGNSFDWSTKEVDHPLINQNYWSRLSTKAVQHGAGVVDLFFKEAELAKARYDLEKAQRPYLGRLIDGFTGVFDTRKDAKPRTIDDVIEEAKRGTQKTQKNIATSDVNTSSTSDVKEEVKRTSPTSDVQKTPKNTPTSEVKTPPTSDVKKTPTPKATTTPTPTPIPSATPNPSPTTTPTPTIVAGGSGSPPPEAPISDVGTSLTSDVLISELQVGGVDAGDEFIELYNPNSAEVDLSTWSIQYLSGSATSTESTVKKNFESGNKISARGFFLIARGKHPSNANDGYTGSVTVDMSYRIISMSGLSAGGKVFLVNDQTKIDGLTDTNIKSSIDYSFSVPENNKSLERKALAGGNCVSPQGTNENLGNGCTTGTDSNIFELRSTPNPQNTSSAKEPLTTGLNSVSFATNTSDSKKYIKLGWDSYPFITTKFKNLASGVESPNNWGIVIFYYNKEASATDDIFWSGSAGTTPGYTSWGLTAPNGLKIKYPNCLGSQTAGKSLILPNSLTNANECSSIAGNYSSYAFDSGKLEDKNLILEVTEDNFATIPTSSDYMTLAVYAYQPGYEPSHNAIRLVTIDPQKYYYSSTLTSSAPSKPASVSFNFNTSTSNLKISWAKSTDTDSLDSLVKYEIKYGATTATTSADFIEISAEPLTAYSFELRAYDDLKNYSEKTTAGYTTPDIPLPYNLTKLEFKSASISLEFSAYPFATSTKTTAIIFFLNQMPPSSHTFLDDDYRNAHKIAGSNKALRFSYKPCDYDNTWTTVQKVAGLFMHTSFTCPTTANGLFPSVLSLYKPSSATSLLIGIESVMNNLEEEAASFTSSDYITAGIYERGTPDSSGIATFSSINNYSKKTYYSP